jgi:hypothetical protein
MTTKKVEINCTTNEVIEREMTKAELDAEKKLQQKMIDETPAVDQVEAAAKVELLNRLGITAEEAKLLLS